MAAEVLGISGSPVPNSNTDRAMKEILRHTQLLSDFVKLSDLNISPCRACLECAHDNECAVGDDGRELAKQFREARAFVVGAYTPYSSLDARTKTFMERMYCFRHRIGGNSRKFGVSVITTACPPGAENLPPAVETAAAQISYWMMEEGITNLGSMVVMGNVPCVRCGHGDECEMSGMKMIHGPDATVDAVGIRSFEDNTSLLEQAKELGEKIRDAVLL